MCASLLSLNQVKKTFVSKNKNHNIPLFESVSFDIKRGETLGIMGKSGVGKTTMGKIISGLESPSSGQVYFYDKDITKMKPQEFKNFRHQVQMMFQDPEGTLNPKKTIKRILFDIRLITRLSPSAHYQLIQKACTDIGLHEDILKYFPWQLSGGMNQRVVLARILMLKPELIVLDEPTSALDLSIQAHILQLLKKIQTDRGISYVFISHDEEIVKWMSHRIGFLKDHSLTISVSQPNT